MNTHTMVLASTFAAVALAAPAIAHAVPDRLGLTARITDEGEPLTGSHAFIVSLHDAATGGAEVWTETITAVIADGLAYLTLGDDTALDAAVLDGGPLWVELQVDGTVVEPRLEVTSAAYAIRAGVAEDAERLGGLPSSSFLPKGATLACTGTQKVTAIDPTSGSIVCGADVDTDTTVSLAGSGVATTAARSDHDHAGAYLPLAASGRTCTGTQKVTSVNADGTVTCAADVDTDTNTTYTAGNGLSLTTNSFAVSWAGTGSTNSSARSDHTHAEVCPTGYTSYGTGAGGGSPLCIKRVTAAATYSAAATDCFVSHAGGQLCTYAELRIGATVAPTQTLSTGYWMGDRVADNWVLRVNGTNTLDFDEEVEVVQTVVTGPGSYCCQRGH